MEIRRAKPSEMDDIMSLVEDVFEREQGIPRWMNTIPAEKDPVWWCIVDEGKIIGTLNMRDEDGQKHMGRFVIAPEARGRHLGTELMRYSLQDAFEHGIPDIFSESRDETVSIQLHLGGRIVGEPFEFYGSNCTPVRITREAFEQAGNSVSIKR